MAAVIDADTHISESTAMWDFMDKGMYDRRPVVVSVPEDTWFRDFNAMWLIDGNIFPKPMGKGSFRLITPSQAAGQSSRTDIEIGSRELTNIAKRLSDMDDLKVDTQVVYPTLFLVYLTDDVELEVALCKAYGFIEAGSSWVPFIWQDDPWSADESSLADAAGWGPAEDWSDWVDAVA